MSKQSQLHAIYSALKKGERITALDALTRFGCLRLSARIFDLRTLGYNIKSRIENVNKKRIAVYWLEK